MCNLKNVDTNIYRLMVKCRDHQECVTINSTYGLILEVNPLAVL